MPSTRIRDMTRFSDLFNLQFLNLDLHTPLSSLHTQLVRILVPRRVLPICMDRVCFSCLRKALGPASRAAGQRQGRRFTAGADPIGVREGFAKKYFWSNNVGPYAVDHDIKPNVSHPALHRVGKTNAHDVKAPSGKRDSPKAQAAEQSTSLPEHTHPHRWRWRRRKDVSVPEQDTSQISSLPLDASAQLAALASATKPNSLRSRALAYLSLSKPRLTSLIVLTTAASYSLYPVAVTPFAAHLTLSPLTFLTLTTGTFLASSSANALNMLLEPEHDAKMSRTRARPLVRGLLSKRAALIFAIVTGTTGTASLYYGVNPTVSFLGALNIVLYAGVYTPLKRMSVLNTWAGAIVGGIPPLMGWTAAAGQASTHTTFQNGAPAWHDLLFAEDGSSVGGWLLAGLLFAWQFPHFWALAYPIRGEYAAAGYRMLVSHNMRMAGRSALRYSIAMFPICAGLSAVGVTVWWFVPASGVVNAWMVKEAWAFWRKEGKSGSARGLFWASVWHLPIVLVLAMVSKRGVWERVVWGGLDAEELRELQDEVEDRKERVQGQKWRMRDVQMSEQESKS